MTSNIRIYEPNFYTSVCITEYSYIRDFYVAEIAYRHGYRNVEIFPVDRLHLSV